MIYLEHTLSISKWEDMTDEMQAADWMNPSLVEAILASETIATEMMMFVKTGDYEAGWLMFATLELSSKLDEFEIEYERIV